MASIRKRNGKWHVQVRRKGCPPLTRSFGTKAAAQTWARQIEADADRRGLPVGLKALDSLTLGDVLTRYRDTISSLKRGAVREGMAVRVLLNRLTASCRRSW